MTTYIFRLIAGLVFLSSGLLKAADTAAFSDLMGQYGASWIGYGAPMVILAEITLALLLVFNCFPRFTALSASVFIVAVSVIFLYGVAAKEITDCGCFGQLAWLNTKPWITFMRNGILLALLLPSVLKPQSGAKESEYAYLIMASVVVPAMFISGFSFNGAKCLEKKHGFKPLAVADSPLAQYVTTSRDSAYLVYAFSYDCPYCMNSIGNVNQYTQMRAVDRVIGLAVNNPKAEERFQSLFDTNFEIHNITPSEMHRIASTLPVAFLIKNDTIIRRFSGTVVSPALLVFPGRAQPR
ncbi:MAG: DoxX family protein [Paludibacteraceae bacterium]|nr:DoxX family protein [Paludibacteraceae bacterium]